MGAAKAGRPRFTEDAPVGRREISPTDLLGRFLSAPEHFLHKYGALSAEMKDSPVNDGPVTLLLETDAFLIRVF